MSVMLKIGEGEGSLEAEGGLIHLLWNETVMWCVGAKDTVNEGDETDKLRPCASLVS